MLEHQELTQHGDEIRLRNFINTDDVERSNWQQRSQSTTGLTYGNDLAAREIAQIPVDEAAMLESLCDLDYLAFSRANDKNAFKRLLKRFPHWQTYNGGF